MRVFLKKELNKFKYGEYCDSCLQQRIDKELAEINYGKTRKVISSREDYKMHLESQYWQTLREVALSKSKYQCSSCGATYGLQAHHLTYKNIGNEHINDVQILCNRCHEREHKQHDENRDWTGHPLYKTQCKATTKKGIRCSKHAIKGSDFCSIHARVNKPKSFDQASSLEQPKSHLLNEKSLDANITTACQHTEDDVFLKEVSRRDTRLANWRARTQEDSLQIKSKQMRWLINKGFDTTNWKRGYADLVIKILDERKAQGLASPKQVKWLIRNGHANAVETSAEDAQEIMYPAGQRRTSRDHGGWY